MLILKDIISSFIMFFIKVFANFYKKFNNKYYVTQTDLSGTFKFKAGDPNVTYVDNKVDLKCSTGYYGGYTATCTLDGDKPKFVYDGYCCKYGYKFVQNGTSITRDVICSGGGTTTNMYTSIATKLTTTDTTNKVASILTSKVDSNNKAVYRDIRVPMMVELWNSSTPGYKKELITAKTSELDIDGKEGYGLALKGLNISSSKGLTISLGTFNTSSSITNNIKDPSVRYTNSYTIKAGRSESDSQNSSYTIQSLAYLCWIGDNNNVNDYCLKRCVGPVPPTGEVAWDAPYKRIGEKATGSCKTGSGWFGTITATCTGRALTTESNIIREDKRWDYSGSCIKGCKTKWNNWTMKNGKQSSAKGIGAWVEKTAIISVPCPSGFSGYIEYTCNGGETNWAKGGSYCSKTFDGEGGSITLPAGFPLNFKLWGQSVDGNTAGYVYGIYPASNEDKGFLIEIVAGGTGGGGGSKNSKGDDGEKGHDGGAGIALKNGSIIVAVAGGAGGNGGKSGNCASPGKSGTGGGAGGKAGAAGSKGGGFGPGSGGCAGSSSEGDGCKTWGGSCRDGYKESSYCWCEEYECNQKSKGLAKGENGGEGGDGAAAEVGGSGGGGGGGGGYGPGGGGGGGYTGSTYSYTPGSGGGGGSGGSYLNGGVGLTNSGISAGGSSNDSAKITLELVL